MHRLIRMASTSAILLLSSATALAQPRPLPDDHDSLVIVFKDGHRQSFAEGQTAPIDFKTPSAIVYKDGHREKLSGQIDRIEFNDSAVASLPGRSHFLGKWEV